MQQRLHNMHALNTWHALSKPPLAGEVRDVWQEPDLHNPTFLAVAALSGFIGFAIRWVPRCCAGGILVAKLCRQGLPWGMSPACTLRRFRRRQQDPPPPPPLPPLQLHLPLVPLLHHPLHLLPRRIPQQNSSGGDRAAGEVINKSRVRELSGASLLGGRDQRVH